MNDAGPNRIMRKWLKGHCNRGRSVPNPTYSTVHRWLARNHPKTGSCEECGRERSTEYANVSGLYLQDRSDYRELCVPCHRRFDKVAYEEAVV